MKLLKYSPLMFFTLLFACEQVVEIDIPEQGNQLVLSSFYKTGDTEIKANLTKSLHILSTENADDVWDATINLYENDVLVGQLEDQIDTLYAEGFIGIDSVGYPVYGFYIQNIFRIYLLELDAPLQAEKTYKMTAEAPGFEPISAIQQLPAAPNILEVTYEPESGLNLDGERLDIFKIKVQDDGEEDNYYEMEVYRRNSNNPDAWNKEYLEATFTPGLENGEEGTTVLSRDDLFNGDTYTLELGAWPISPSNEIKVVVKAISRDKYLFSKSIYTYWNADGNPFAEPVIVPTNVENGLGIFSMENSLEFIVQ